MTKRILLGFLILALMIGMVSAVPMPMPIFGKVMIDGVSTEGVSVYVTSLTTQKEIKLVTDNEGSYSFDANDLALNEEGIYPGQYVKFKVCENFAGCERTLKLSDRPVKFNIEVGSDLVSKVEIIKERIVEVQKEVLVAKDADLSLLNSKLDALNAELASVKAEMGKPVIEYRDVKTTPYELYVALGLSFFGGILALFGWLKSKGKIAQAKKTLSTVLNKAGKDKYKK